MKLHFYIRYHTNFGERLFITGNIEELGNSDPASAVPMQYLNDEFWHATIEVDVTRALHVQYNYVLQRQNGSQINDWGDDRVIDLSAEDIEEIDAIDTWNYAGEFENAFFTSPFQEVLFTQHQTKIKVKKPKKFTHIFKVKSPLLKKNEVVCLIGSSLSLGEWNANDPLLLALEDHWWSIKVDMPQESFPVSYKYGVFNVKDKKMVTLENGQNRHLPGNPSGNKLTVVHDGFEYLPNNTWKAAGVAIPVFSLKSKESFGVGEFTDIRLLADWAKETGLKLIQILPVNDTTATHSFADSYPYAAVSAFALHPIYINLEEVGDKKSGGVIKQYKKKQKQLNDLPDLDYEEVMKLKLAALKELFVEDEKRFLKNPDYLEFFEANKNWLLPYAAYCYLRDKNGTTDFTRWKIYSVYDKAGIEKYASPKAKHYDSIALQYFIQYHLHLQLKDAANYAHKRGVILKGDIPIGVYRYSCDAWMNPELFNMNMQAGAPPDDFAVKGQNWGFPTYNWKKMAEDKFSWWRQRFEQMRNYFDAFRIDHILGFFRIWSIPITQVEGIMGYFVPAIPVQIKEFQEKGIWFDYNRYTQPYINDEVLETFFTDNVEQVKSTYLDEISPGQFKLKAEYNTQQKVQEKFAGVDLPNDSVQEGLFDLISNVIFFEPEGADGKLFHFRINMENTISFKFLDDHTKAQLKDLYVDYFFRRQDGFWLEEALHKLPALKASTNMLVCGEDLGMVPHCVPELMSQLGILSLEIQRMPKAANKQYFHPNDAPYLSVVTPSTHDMSTVRGWWKEDPQRTQWFYNHELGQWGEAPHFAESWISKSIILQHLYSPAMFSIFQLQDLLGMSDTIRRENPDEERINIPANPKHYWRYRMHITLEQLLKEKEFNQELSHFIQASGR